MRKWKDNVLDNQDFVCRYYEHGYNFEEKQVSPVTIQFIIGSFKTEQFKVFEFHS